MIQPYYVRSFYTATRIGMVFLLVFFLAMECPPGICPSSYAVTELESVNGSTPAVQPITSAREQTNEAQDLLARYFDRTDAYIKNGNYQQAKCELKKIFLLDETNERAREYDHIIERALQNELKQQEATVAQYDALHAAEQTLRSDGEVRDAMNRLKQRDYELVSTEEGDYLREEELDLEEFERLQSLGVDRYKAEVLAEAQDYLRRNNYDKAIARYRDALAVDPGDLALREQLNKALHKREEQVDDLHLGRESVEDIEFMKEVTKSAMGIDDYRRGMQGHGYAKAHVGPKPKTVPSIYEKMQIPITADFRDVDLVSVINFLSDYTGINIITSQIVGAENRPITVRFKELPLERALKYIIKGQSLRMRVDNDVIYIATADEMDTEELETRVYYLSKGSGVFNTFSSSNMGLLGSTGGSASVSARKSVKELIEEAVPFPPGAKVVFDDRTGALIVTNTPTNLQKIEEILYTIDEPPQQILIESRFIEVNMEEWETLGVEMGLDSHLYTSGDQKKAVLNSSGFDFTGIANAISSETGGINLAFGGLLTDPQYTLVLNALERMEKTKTLSAPKITTINNQTATIKVVTEEVFPTRFEVSLIQQDLNGDGDLDDAGETEFANVPQEFVSRDIGVLLQVTPSVGIDQRTITLSIVPEVSAVAPTPASFAIASQFDESGNVTGRQSSGTPDLPRFTTSTLSTTVVLESGETAVLGGLIKETRGKTQEKVPLLGDIPVLGNLFKSNQDTLNRTNLIIFITARVIK